MKKEKVIYQWDNIDFDYPSCGGTIGRVHETGKVIVEEISNYIGSRTGVKTVWALSPHVVELIKRNKLGMAYNDWRTYADMLRGDGLAHIATLVRMINRGHLVQ